MKPLLLDSSLYPALSEIGEAASDDDNDDNDDNDDDDAVATRCCEEPRGAH